MASLPPPTDWTPERVKALRSRLGLSQTAFAEALGFTRHASVLDLEKGNTTATGATARLLDVIEAGGVEAVAPRRDAATLADDLDELARLATSAARRARGEARQ